VQFLRGGLCPGLLGVLCACVLGIVFSGVWLCGRVFALLFALGVLWSALVLRIAGPVLAWTAN
jgi:hypothetical protein